MMQHVALVGDAGKTMILHDGGRANMTTTNGMITTSEREQTQLPSEFSDNDAFSGH
jgi:hypothetical protein